MGLPSLIDYTLPTASELPDPVVNWALDPTRCALLVHDLQAHFLRPYAPALREKLVGNAASVLQACRQHGIPVAHTHQPDDQSPEERGLLTDFWGPGPSSTGRAAPTGDDPLAAVDGEAVIVRRRYNAFLGTELDQWLRENGRDQLIVCGIYAHIGCLMTSAHAFMTERQPFMVADATADFSAQEHRMALEYVACRLGRSLTTHDVLQALSPTPGQNGHSLESLRSRVAELVELPIEQVRPDDDLASLGLDSMRRMKLVEDLAQTGTHLDFIAVALAETCTDLHALAASGQAAA